VTAPQQAMDAAPIGLVPVADVREALLRPAPGRTLKLLGEDRAPCGDIDCVVRGPGDPLVHLPDALPVEARRGGAGAGKPVEHEIVQELVAGEHVLGVAITVGPGPELLDDPGAECGRRVHERVADRLGSGGVLLGVAGVPLAGVLERGERSTLSLRELVEGGRVWWRERRDEVDAGDVAGIQLADARADARPPVAALGAVARVAKPAHQNGLGGGDPLDAPAGAARLVAEAVAG
jgi:hypothetical protein